MLSQSFSMDNLLPSTEMSASVCGRRRRSRLAVAAVALLCLLYASPSQGETMEQAVEAATKQLESKFQEIRKDILGADALVVRPCACII